MANEKRKKKRVYRKDLMNANEKRGKKNHKLINTNMIIMRLHFFNVIYTYHIY